MNKHLRRFLQVFCAATLSVASMVVVYAKGSKVVVSSTTSSTSVSTEQASAMLGKSGLEFVENKGQVVDTKGNSRPDIKFSAHSNGTNVYFLNDKIMYAFSKVEGKLPGRGELFTSEMRNKMKFSQYRLDLELVGANTKSTIVPNLQREGLQNFYTSATSSSGVTDVRAFGKLVYEGVYDGIDMIVDAEGKAMKSEFRVRPGADPSVIAMNYAGAESVELTSDGGYVVKTPMGDMTEHAPYSYVIVDGKQVEVKSSFEVNGTTVRVKLAEYDKNLTLVIDPSFDWGSFMGGAGEDVVNAVTTQRGGFNPAAGTQYIWIAGYTATFAAPFNSGNNFGSTGGSYDAFVASYAYGGSRSFVTRFGSNQTDFAYGVAVDASGVAYVCGEVGGADGSFATAGAFQTTFQGDVSDGFIVKVNSSGQRTAATFIGSAGEDHLMSIALDANGNNLTVGGYTAGTTLGTTNTFAGVIDGIVLRMATDLSSRTWGTFVGTANDTYITGVANIGTSGQVFACGYTRSNSNIATAGSLSAALNNNGTGTSTGTSAYDGFAIHMTSAGARDAGTYLGGADNDRAMGVAYDGINDRCVVVGYGNSINTGAQHIASIGGGLPQSQVNGNNVALGPNDGWVVRLAFSGTQMTRNWGTFWGSPSEDKLFGVWVDDNNVTAVAPNTASAGSGGRYFVCGQSNNTVIGNFHGGGGDFTIAGNNSNMGAADGVWTQCSPGASTTTFELSAITGTNQDDAAYGVMVDNQRNVHVAGYAIGTGGQNLANGTGAQPTSAGGTNEGFSSKFCNLVKPNQPSLTTSAAPGGVPGGALSACSDNNVTSSGSASSGAGGAGCLADIRTATWVHITNAIQGVTYTVRNVSSSTTVATATAGSDGNLDIDISSQLSSLAVFPGPSSAGTIYNIRVDASSQVGCSELGAGTAPLTIYTLASNSITQSVPGANAPSSFGSLGNEYNFFGCANNGGANTYNVTANAGYSYQWCVYPASAVSGGLIGANTNSLTLAFANVSVATTCTLRVRETLIASGCAKEYVAYVRLLPVASMTLNNLNGTVSTGNNTATHCSGTTVASFGNSSLYSSTSYTSPTETQSTFWWSTSGATGVAPGAWYSASSVVPGNNASGSTTVNFSTAAYTANPATVNIVLNSRNTSTGLGVCDRTITYPVTIYSKPTISSIVQQSPVAGTNACENGSMTFRVTLQYPGGAAFASQPIAYQATILRTNLTGGTAGPLVATATTNVSGEFDIVVSDVGAVSSAYDALGTINVNVNVTNNHPGAVGLNNCTSAAFATVLSNNVTQKPDVVNVSTSAGNNTVGGPWTTVPNTTAPANVAQTTTACVYNSVAGFGQEYTYSVAAVDNGTSANNDSYTWTFPGTATLVSGGSGINSKTVTLRWGVGSIGSGNLVQCVQTNNQNPSTCATTHNQLNVTVNSLPSATLSWSSSYVCESGTVSLNVTGGPANGKVQVYSVTNSGPGSNVGVYSPPAYAVGFLPLTEVTLNGSGAGTVTFTSGQLGTLTSLLATTSAYQDVVASVSVVNPATNCGSTINTTTIRVYDILPAVIVAGPTPVCANKASGVNSIQPPSTPNAPYSYSVSNTGSYPAAVSGITYAWTLTGVGGVPTYTNGTDYTISLSSSGVGNTNNLASVTYGTNIAPSNVEWHVTATMNGSSGGCTSSFGSVAQAVTVLADPTPNIAGNDANGNSSLSLPGLCSGQVATYTATDLTGGNVYTWSISGAPSYSASVPGFGLYQVTWGTFNAPSLVTPVISVQIQNAAGCVQGDTQTVYLRPVPQTNTITQTPTTGPCTFNGENAHIVAYTVPKSTSYIIQNVVWTVSGGGTIYSYTTTNNPSQVMAGANDTVRIQWNSTGAQTVDATVTTTYGCSTIMNTLNTFVYPTPNPVISGAASICKGTTTTYNALPNVAGDTYTWDIVPSVAGNSFTTSSSGLGVTSVGVNWNGAPNTSYTLRCTQVSAMGCTARTTYTITINPNPTPVVSGPTSVCQNQVATYSTNNNSPNNSYVWTLNGGTATFVGGVNNTASVQVNTGASSFQIKVLETVNTTSCNTETSYTSVTVQAAPNPTITRTSPATGIAGAACTGSAYTYTCSPSSGVTYQWSLNGTALTGETNASHTRTWSSTGSNTLSCTVTLTSTQCSTTVNQAIVVSNPPSPSVSGPNQVCGGGASPTVYTYSTTLNSGNSYSWSATGGIGTVTSQTPSSGTGVNTWSVTFSGSTTTKNIAVVETDPNTGCQTTSTNYVVTSTQRPNPVILPASSAVCQNSTGNQYNITASRISGSTIAWAVTGGTITQGQGSDVITVTWTTAGTGSISVTETNGSCSASNATAYNVVVNPAPTAYNVSTSTPTLCATSSLPSVIVNLSGSQTGVNYTLYRGATSVGSAVAGTGSPLQFSDATYGGAGTYNYTVVGVNASTTCSTIMTNTATVTVNALPNATVSGSATSCSGVSQTYSVTAAGSQTYNWSVPSGWNITSGGTTNAMTATVGTSSGSVSVVVTNTTTTCSNSGSLAVTVTAAPTVFNVTPTVSGICLGQGTTIGLSGSQVGVTYTVSKGAQTITTQTGTGSALTISIPASAVSTVGAHTFTMTALGAAPCNASAITMNGSMTVTVNPLPAPAVTGSTSACIGQASAYSTPATTNNYSWSMVTGTATFNGPTNTNSVSVTFTGTPGNRVLQVVETNPNTGCTQSATITVAASASPSPSVQPGPTASACASSTQTYSTTNNVGNGYAWTVTGAGGQITGGQGQNAVSVQWGSAAGTGIVSVTETAGSCSSTSSTTVTVNATPIAYNVGTTTSTVCVTGNALITVSNSQAGFTYTLSRNGTAQTPTVTGTGGQIQFTNSISAAGTYGYTVTATGSGCSNLMSGTATVVAVNPPTPTLSGSTTVCSNSSATYSVTPQTAGSTYQFSVSGSGNTLGSQSGNQQVVNWGTNSGTLSVNETNGSCVGSTSLAVTVLAAPVSYTVTMSPATICAGGGLGSNATTATVGLTGSQIGYTYELVNAQNNVVRSATGTGSALTFSPVLSNLAAGSYVYSVRAISNTTPVCSTATMSNNVTLTVVANPAPAITGSTTPCQNATVTYQTTNNTGSTYTWNVVSGTGSFAPLNTYQVSGSWSTIGAASIRVVETNSNGCAQENILNVTVSAAPTPTISASTASPVCGQSSVTYSTTATGQSYAWTVGSGGQLVSGNNSQSIVVSWSNATPDVAYTSSVGLTVTNGGCSGSASTNVTVNPKANPTISGDATRCSGQSGSYSTPFVVSGRSYSWTISNLPPGMTFTPVSGTNVNAITVNWVNTGAAPVVATVQVVETPGNAGNTCTGTSTFNVTVNPLPSVSISGPAQVCQNSSASYTITPAVTGLSYAWSVSGANSFSGQGSGTISVAWGTTNGTVSLTVTNNATGCTNNALNNNYAVTTTANPTPSIATPPGTTACAGSTVTYNVLNPSTSFNYTWANTGATSASTPAGNSYTLTWPTTPGTGTVTLTATTNSGATCSGSTLRTVTITANPTPTISGLTSVCPASDITYSTSYNTGNTYAWSIPAGTFTVTGGSLTSNTVTVRWNNPGTSAAVRTVTITETSQTGCVGSAQVSVTVNPAPSPTVAGNTNTCGFLANYDGVSINNLETYTVTNPVNNQSTFVWSLPNGGGTFTTASQGVNVTSVTVQWNEPTTSASVTRVLRVQETTNATPACAGQTDVNVQVNWNPKPAITGNRTVCSNSQYAANSTNAQMYAPYTYVTPGLNQTINPPASAYSWDVRDVNNVSILTSNPATTVPGARITGTGNQVQVEYFNPTNAPVTMVLRVTESIAYNQASLTPSVKSCPITDSFVVVVNPMPKPIIAPAPTDVCGRSTATYATTGDAASTFGWSAGSGSIVGASNANSVTVTWNNATVDNTAGFVQVTQTFNATGCATTVRQNVNIDVTPAPVITGSAIICQGTTNGTNTATYSVASVLPNRSYLWSIDSPTSGAVTLSASGANNGSSFTVIANGNTTVPVTGVIRLRETATDATNNGASGAGCFAETTYSITINPNPTPVIASSTGGLNVNGVCSGSTHVYTTTNNTANTYSWTVTGGSFVGSSTTNTVTVLWGAAGAGSIAVRERVGAAGCYTDVTAPITVRPLPTPDLTNQTGGQNPTSVCAQGSATYVTPNVVGNSYAWSVNGGTINGAANTNILNVVWGAAGTGSVSVTETTPVSLGSCSATRTLAVTINPLPTPSIQGPPNPPVCINSTQTYTTALNAGRTYQWSGVTGGSFVGATNTNTVNVTWTAAGNGTITVTETNTTTGCVGTSTRTIAVNALPNVTITPSGPTSLCVGGTVTLAATDGFASYTWSTGETTPRITVRQAGTYSVTVIDGNGCRNTSSSITVTTTSFTKPTVSLNGTASFCEGESRTLTAQTTGGTPLAYRWSNGATTSSITVSASGTFNVEVTYSNSCKIVSDDVTITVSPKPTVSVTASGSTKFCEGGNVVLDAGAGYASYSWKNGATTVGNGRTLRVTAAGSYTVTVANAAGCTATSTATAVTVNANPTATITALGNTSFCQGDSVTLDAGAGYQSYAWSPGGATTQKITVRNGGNYFVTVTDTNGCSGQSAPKSVTVFPTPQKPGVTRVGNLMTVDTAGKGYVAFQWKFNNTDISGATSVAYDAFRTGLGLYKVVITDRNGCTNESDPIRIDTVLDVTDPSALAQGVSLYPNPTTGSLTVKVSLDQDAQSVVLTVRNIVGATMISYTLDNLVVGENIKPLDLSILPSGVYMVEVAMPNGKRISARITKVD